MTRAQFEQNIQEKLGDALFTADIGPLLASGHTWEIASAAEAVNEALIRLLPDSMT